MKVATGIVAGKAKSLIFRVVRWLLAIVAIMLIITGLGITEFRIVGMLTLGLLGKALSFKLHTYLWILFTVLLAFHICYSVYTTGNRGRKSQP